MNKCQGTIIRRTPLTESSQIITWCTEGHGIIRAVAKGARRPKSAFAGKLDLFFETEFEIARSKKSDLHILRDLVVTSPRFGLRDSYLQTLAASYFVQLLDLVAEPETPIAPLHNLLARALDYLESSKPDRRAVIHFETQLATSLGVLDPECPAAETIAGIYNRLPKSRSELLERIGMQT
jgi:DNA repair protein RecO (recombination protein O)